MKLSQLRSYEIICKHSNITKASEELHISQPSLSGVINDLEREFGVTLFYRQRNGLRITAEGKRLLELSRALTGQADELVREMTELGQKKSTVRLGLPPMIGSIVFPSIFSALKERCPNTELKITETGSITGISLVLDGTLDAAIISSNSRLPSSIDYINVRDVRILFYFNINEPIGDMLLVDYERIRDFPLVLLSEDSFGSAFVNGEFKKRGLQPNVILHTNQLFTIRNLLNNRSAATFLYEGILDPSEEDIAAVPLPDNPAVHIRLIWNKNHQQPNGLRDMIKMIRRGNF